MNSEWACLAIDVEAFDDTALSDGAIDRLGQGLIDLLRLQLPHGSAHRFEPHGVSLVRFGHHGRLAIHTWPERNVATIDLWLRRADITNAEAHVEQFLADRHNTRVTARSSVGR